MTHRSQGKRKNWAPTKGGKIPRFHVDLGDHVEIADAPLGDHLLPKDQLILEDKDGVRREVELFPGMDVATLRRRVGDARGCSVSMHCDEPNTDAYEKLLSQAYPSWKLEHVSTGDAGMHRVPVRVEFQLTPEYFRAIAKIGFHYYLLHSRRGRTGAEPMFAPIREFICHGGEVERFVTWSGSRFAIPFHENRAAGYRSTPTKWCHLLAASEEMAEVLGHVQMFVGPDAIPRAYMVRIGVNESRIVVPGAVWGHAFEYDQSSSSRKYRGEMKAATISRLRPR